MIIYKIKNNINGKVYIGQTTRNLELRIEEHIRKKSTIGSAILKYGMCNFTINIIDSATTIDVLNEKEIYYIEKYNSMVPNGYNLCLGGGNTKGYTHTEETKRLMSELKQGIYEGENNPFFGKTHSEAQKRKWSKSRKGVNLDKVRSVMIKNHKRKVRNLDTKLEFDSIKEASEYYGLKATHITRVCKGKRKRTGGYRWEYVSI